MDTLGERIKFMRDNMGLTQKELAEKIGIMPSTLGKYTKNVTDTPSSIVRRMAIIFNTTTDYLLGLTDDYSAPNGEQSSSINAREQNLIFNFRELSEIDKTKVEERILTLLSNK